MKFIKKNSKYIGIVMVCVFCSYLTTIATNYIFESSDVRFDNTGTSLESVNVQDAIDETFHHVTDYNEIKTTIGNSTLTTTNQTLIGGINELNSNLGLPSSASGVTGADAFSKINTLNGKLTTVNYSSNIAAGQSGTSLADAYLKKVGNVITMSCVLKNDSTSASKTISAYAPLVTFPASIGRPSQHIWLCARMSDGSVKDFYVSKYAVSEDSTKGQVIYADALTLPASGWVKFSVTWIV